MHCNITGVAALIFYCCRSCKLTFADSRDKTWSATARVVVKGFAERAIRFGTAQAAAPRSRLFVTDGGVPLYVGKDGYVTAIPPSTRIIIR